MKNLAMRSIRVVWDGLREYEAYKEEYDYMGKLHDCSGLDYLLIDILSKGDRFCHHAEALIKKAFGLKDSPRCNSPHDAEYDHPLYGKCRMEIRCVQKSLSTLHATEVGGGGRSPTQSSNAKGLKTHWNTHRRGLHKLEDNTHFGVCILRCTPELFISIVETDTLIDLWKREQFGIVRKVDGEDRWLLPLSISRSQYLNMIYGTTNLNQIKWDDENPWSVPEKRRQENIVAFNNQRGYDESSKRVSILIEKLKREEIDKAIAENPELYNFTPEITLSKKRPKTKMEIVDCIDMWNSFT